MSTAALVSGQLDSIAPGVRRLVANNPGYMTGPGTNTYLVGEQHCLVIDPGPDEAVHVERILAATGGQIAAVLVTHTHRDHSPAAMTLANRSAAEVLGRGPPDDGRQDLDFDDVDPHLHPLAKSSLLAHLLKLEKDGRVRRAGSGVDAVWTAHPS